MTKKECVREYEIDGKPVTYEKIISRWEIETRVDQLAKQISQDYDGKKLTVVVTMNGGMYFAVDLTRKLPWNINVDSITVAHYSNGASPNGEPRILSDLKTPISGRHVILLDEVVETGESLRILIDMLSARNPASLEVCALFAKPQQNSLDRQIKYLGFLLQKNDWIMGGGCDDHEMGRAMPDIWRRMTS